MEPHGSIHPPLDGFLVLAIRIHDGTEQTHGPGNHRTSGCPVVGCIHRRHRERVAVLHGTFPFECLRHETMGILLARCIHAHRPCQFCTAAYPQRNLAGNGIYGHHGSTDPLSTHVDGLIHDPERSRYDVVRITDLNGMVSYLPPPRDLARTRSEPSIWPPQHRP